MYTSQDIRDMDSGTLNLIGFVLNSKINGRIIRHAMRMASKEMNTKVESGIDGYNDTMAAFEAIEQQNVFFQNNGKEAQADDSESLAMWLGARHALQDAGYNVSPLSESLGYFIKKESESHAVSEDEIALLASKANLKVEEIKAILKKKADRGIGQTKERCLLALQIINDVEPNEETPEGFNEVVLEAIESSKKGAVIRSNNPEESLANLILLEAMSEAA